jgi:predicted HTH domain antitoxin
MVQMLIEMPEEALAALHKNPESFAKEMRLAAAIKWYELGILSQGRAAGVAALSRAEFIDALGRFRVTRFQYSGEEIIEEATRECMDRECFAGHHTRQGGIPGNANPTPRRIAFARTRGCLVE